MTKSKNQKILDPLFIAGLEFQDTIKKNNWSFCFIGGLAVIRWGEIRITQDVDICLLCGFGNEEKYIKTLLEIYNSRISDAYNFALTNRVLLLYASNGVSIDIALSGLTFEKQMMEIVKKHNLPYKYTGNFSFWIDRANPERQEG